MRAIGSGPSKPEFGSGFPSRSSFEILSHVMLKVEVERAHAHVS